ncbi:MAG TPA: sigma-70 family RNA polymerase sigma factor [Candidatus Coprosoma intestinipullorum]|uniref:Sigma-70 family RNA polymerase sigma factor n=1 Tax=Candidatus Coprosoma intestinipullorum TaxID=2840752 RepID=A0A9D0ZRR4_9FIRM|nr:sigma-70 family RNA polymerase sigma factor [Candidatus Coprosoma intestinipullorum]
MIIDLKEELIKNQKLIYSIAKKFKHQAPDEDLFQAGCLGMIEAYKNYDSSYGTKFTTYAYPYILGSISEYVRENRQIKLSKDISQLKIRIDKTKILLAQNLMKIPTNEEISNFLSLPLELISKIESYQISCTSLDELTGDELSKHEIIGDKFRDNDYLIALKEELENLEEPERTIMKERYFEDLTQAEVAKNLGITQVDVSRKERKTLIKLRHKLN